jgi:hypothetical protein
VAEIVRFALADGKTIDLRRDDLRLIYEELWQLANEPGAVSTAAILLHAASAARSSSCRIAIATRTKRWKLRPVKQLDIGH